VLSELVTERGTKRPRSERELVDQTGLRAGEVRAVMNGLWTAALARPLDAAQGVWELSHDFVARAVARYLGRRRLDWPGVVRAYAASALFGLMAAAVAGTIIWNANAADRLRAELANLGIEVSSDGLEAATGSRFKGKDWDKSGPLLSRVTTLQSLDLSAKSNLPNFFAFNRLDLPITDIRPLKGLRALHKLNLSFTLVADIGPLKGLTGLQQLDLSYTHVADLAPLKGLTALQSLDLTDTKVADLGALEGLTALQALNLSETLVVDLAHLKGLTALQKLDLGELPFRTKVTDLAPVQDLPNLEQIVGAPTAELEKLNSYRAQKKLPIISNRSD
jgi:hypothetical protein